MAAREPPRPTASGRPVDYQYPGGPADGRRRHLHPTSPPSLPSMSSLLASGDSLGYDGERYPPPHSYQFPHDYNQPRQHRAHPPQTHSTPPPPPPSQSQSQLQSQSQPPKHPLWHSEQNPEAHPQHLYHPPQPQQHVSPYPTDPHMVPNPQNMAAPVSQQTDPGQARRQVKTITQRRDDPKNVEPFQRPASITESRYPPPIPPESVPPPLNARPAYERKDSFSSEISSQTVQSSRTYPVSGPLSAISSPIHPAPPQPIHTISMRQQPLAARACGFGERDRRVIDPPPILQMTVSSPQPSTPLTPSMVTQLLKNPFTVVHAVLWDPVTNTNATTMPLPVPEKRQQRRLMGTLVSSPFPGTDEFDKEGCFFTFPDLSVRTPGTYSLKFSLVVLDPVEMGRKGYKSKVASVCFSAPFTVYNAKDFRGMRPSTALTKRLKGQGCLISVKKGNGRGDRRGGDGTGDEDDDDDGHDDTNTREEHDEEMAGRRGKKARR